MKGARDRARRERGKCEGRKSYAERKGGRELIAAGAGTAPQSQRAPEPRFAKWRWV